MNVERTERGVRAEFADGTTVSGAMLVGADGNSSVVRKLLAPTTYPVHRLPINALGVGLDMTEEQYISFKAIDPLYFMGTHPETNTYTFWSLLGTPREKGQPYPAQLYFSWLKSEHDEETFKMPLIDIFKEKGRPFFPKMREVVDSLADDTLVTSVNLVDWPSVEWDNWAGKCTLIGDAAHCMVICNTASLLDHPLRT